METLSGNDPRHYNDIKDTPMEQPIVQLRMPSWSNVESAIHAMFHESDVWPENDSRKRNSKPSKWRSDGEFEKATLKTLTVGEDFFKPVEGSFFPLWQASNHVPLSAVRRAQAVAAENRSAPSHRNSARFPITTDPSLVRSSGSYASASGRHVPRPSSRGPIIHGDRPPPPPPALQRRVDSLALAPPSSRPRSTVTPRSSIAAAAVPPASPTQPQPPAKASGGGPAVQQLRLDTSVRKPIPETDAGPVDVMMRLEMDRGSIPDERAFRETVRGDVAAASGLGLERVRVTGVRAGSVWVDMTLLGDERKGAMEAVRSLQQQLADPASRLKQGAVTRHATEIRLGRLPPAGFAEPSPTPAGTQPQPNRKAAPAPTPPQRSPPPQSPAPFELRDVIGRPFVEERVGEGAGRATLLRCRDSTIRLRGPGPGRPIPLLRIEACSNVVVMADSCVSLFITECSQLRVIIADGLPPKVHLHNSPGTAVHVPLKHSAAVSVVRIDDSPESRVFSPAVPDGKAGVLSPSEFMQLGGTELKLPDRAEIEVREKQPPSATEPPPPSADAAPADGRPNPGSGKGQKTAQIRVILDDVIERLAPSEAERQAVCAALAADLAAALHARPQRFRVTALEGGVVILDCVERPCVHADMDILPDPAHADPRSPQQLGAQVVAMSRDPASYLYRKDSLRRLVRAEQLDAVGLSSPTTSPPPPPTTARSAAMEGGVGATYEIPANAYPVIKDLARDGPADASGAVFPGDVLLAVDGQSTFGVSAQTLSGMVLGVPGSVVRFTLRGTADERPRTATLTRRNMRGAGAEGSKRLSEAAGMILASFKNPSYPRRSAQRKPGDAPAAAEAAGFSDTYKLRPLADNGPAPRPAQAAQAAPPAPPPPPPPPAPVIPAATPPPPPVRPADTPVIPGSGGGPAAGGSESGRAASAGRRGLGSGRPQSKYAAIVNTAPPAAGRPRVRVRVQRARNLPVPEQGGPCHTYVIAAIGQAFNKTEVDEMARPDPVWDAAFEFPVDPAVLDRALLTLTVEDHRAHLKDEPLGQLALPLHVLLATREKKGWFDLQPGGARPSSAATAAAATAPPAVYLELLYDPGDAAGKAVGPLAGRA